MLEGMISPFYYEILIFFRDTVMTMLRFIDRCGDVQRKSKRLKRGIYRSKYAHYLNIIFSFKLAII